MELGRRSLPVGRQRQAEPPAAPCLCKWEKGAPLWAKGSFDEN